MYPLARPFLFGLDAERAHALGLSALETAYRTGMNPLLARKPQPFQTRVFGLQFPNRSGSPPGWTRTARVVDALLALGFGFRRGRHGHARPQPATRSRACFACRNTARSSTASASTTMASMRWWPTSRARRKDGLLGINIGKNKDTPNESAARDYLHCLERVYPLADYVTVNISSPNTAGLRELQEEQALRQLLGTLREAQERLGAQHGRRVPMLVKLAPDLSDADIDAAGRVLSDLQVDGVIATNTTISRIAVEHSPLAREPGGLSGEPLMNKVHRGAAHAHAAAGFDSAGRRRRDHARRRRDAEDRRRREPGADLHRAGLPRPEAGRRMRRRDPPAQGIAEQRARAVAMTAAWTEVRDASLRMRNTFGVEATAPLLVEVADAAALPGVLARHAGDAPMLLGGGSNLLFAGNPPGAVIARSRPAASR